MPENFKTFNIALDTKKALYGERVVLVEGDTGNRFVITLTDDGSAVDLTDCRVDVVFSGAMGTAMQNSYAENGKVTIGGTLHNEVTIDVKSGSYSTGLNTCEIRVLSGESYETLVTSASFTFNGKKPIIDESTIAASSELPILVSLIAQVSDLTTREQSDWTQTDDTQGNYIQHKPVAGTGFQDATQNLIEETSILTTDIAPMYRPTGTAHHFKATVASWIVAIRTAIFGTTSGMLKANGSGVISAAVANTDYAASLHAARHSVGSSDALTGYEKERLSFADQTVTTSGWATYSEAAGEETKIKNKNYIYRKSLALDGVLSTMSAYIMPSEDKADCGALICPRVITYDGGIYIYAKSVPTAAFVLLRIDCFKAVG